MMFLTCKSVQEVSVWQTVDSSTSNRMDSGLLESVSMVISFIQLARRKKNVDTCCIAIRIAFGHEVHVRASAIGY